jgi:hypothetical protein
MLPGLLLRSLIPLGFMPIFVPGYGMRLIVCESYAPLPGMASSMSAGMHRHVHGHAATGSDNHLQQNVAPLDGAPAHQHYDTCPYSGSPALGGLPAPAVSLVAIEPGVEPAVISAQVDYFKVSPRAQSSRGPPA